MSWIVVRYGKVTEAGHSVEGLIGKTLEEVNRLVLANGDVMYRVASISSHTCADLPWYDCAACQETDSSGTYQIAPESAPELASDPAPEPASAVSNIFGTMDIRAYIGVSIAGLVAGAIAGGIGGLSLGWLLEFNDHRRGPSDPGDAPLYVAMGLTRIGACVGAVAGFFIGIVYSVRLARRRKGSPSVRPSETGYD